MTFPGSRNPSNAFPKLPRPLRGGPIPVSEDDLPFYAALVGRATNADDRMAVLLSSFDLPEEVESEQRPGGWRQAIARARQIFSFKQGR